jgi:hypothetical protein
MTTEKRHVFWQNHFGSWRCSGQSQRTYCQQHALKFANFGSWRSRLGKAKRSHQLIPVELGSNVQARLSLPNGIRLEVPFHALADVLPLLNRAAQ